MCAGHQVTGGHAAAITADGGLWVWGGNAAGQLGLGAEAPAWVSEPTHVNIPNTHNYPAPSVAVACGHRHTIVLLSNGTVWSAGDNRAGACGLPSEVPEVHTAPDIGLSSSCSTSG